MTGTGIRPVLILGGTEEARVLAALLVERDIARPVTSLAGATSRPKPIAGNVRVGPFGGVAALADHIRGAGYAAVIDATHPFATRMSANAVEACAEANVPRLVLSRLPWSPRPDDRWIGAADEGDAVQQVRSLVLDPDSTVFLALGAKRIDAFSKLPGHRKLLRAIDLTEPPFPGCRVVNGRGPFTTEAEIALFQSEEVAALVCRNSGGSGTAKLGAARKLNLPVVMIARPPTAPGASVTTVADAIAWITGIVD